MGLQLDAASAALTSPPGLQVTLTDASPYERRLSVTAPTATQLRFTDFYFPGWEVWLDGSQQLSPYPSTSLGLLTVDVPPGTHSIQVRWQDTLLRRWATWLSLFTLAALSLWAVSQTNRRWLAALPGLLLLLGGFAALKPLPAPAAIQTPPQPVLHAGLSLLGFRWEQSGSDDLTLYPYWQTHNPMPRLVAAWRLTTPGGELVAETATEPYFGASHMSLWPAGTVVDDAYRLALPSGLASGDYELWLQFRAYAEPAPLTVPVRVGHVRVNSVPLRPPQRPSAPVDARFAANIQLAGFDLRHNGRAPANLDALLPVARGDVLAYTLFWQNLAPVEVNFHGFIHLRDAGQGVLVKRDHLAGSWQRASLLWDPFHLQPDHYRVEISHRRARRRLLAARWPVSLRHPGPFASHCRRWLFPRRHLCAASHQGSAALARAAPARGLGAVRHPGRSMGL